MYFEDNHAGTFHFLATSLDLNQSYALVLVDAHSDASISSQVALLRQGIQQVRSPEERESRLRAWRRKGTVQAFDWVAPLMPRPIKQVIWVNTSNSHAANEEDLPAGYVTSEAEHLTSVLQPDLPVVVSIDLDAFSGAPPEVQNSRFSNLWKHIVQLPRLSAITFAISRPWLVDDAEASRLLALGLTSSLSLAHATIRWEPYGLEGPDRSEKAKSYYRKRKEPPRFDPETVSPELRSLLMAHADRLEVRLDPARWNDLLDRWRAEGSDWKLSLDGVEPGSDFIYRPQPGTRNDLRLEGGPPGVIRRVTWIQWTPRAWSYNVLPDLPAGKMFAGVAPPVMDFQPTVLAQTQSNVLEPEVWERALSGPGHSGILRMSADVETEVGLAHTARIEIRRGLGTGFHAGLSEQFGLPYVFGAGALRRGFLRGPDTGIGNDCANFLVYAWRQSGLRMPWCNPAQLKRHLTPVTERSTVMDQVPIPKDAAVRGMVIHLGSHVAALWEDREPTGTLGPEDLVIHHLGGAPEVLPLGELLARRDQTRFDVFLGPAREPVAWIALGGDLVPGEGHPPPSGLRERLLSADLAVANLETTVGRGGAPKSKRYVFQVPPRSLADIRGLGIGALSLANNHVGDFGTEGLIGTLRTLQTDGLGYFGAGMNTQQAVSAWYGHVKGITVGFIAISMADPDLLPASPKRPGLAVLPKHQREIQAAIATARGKADCVIVMPHWGDEGTTALNEEQRHWARWLVAQGADAVVGSGPHVVQTRESITGAPVFYSLGNLWFNGTWPLASRTAALAYLGLDRNGRIVATTLELISNVGEPKSRRDAH